MFCKNCGLIILEGSRFCTSCGAKISADDLKKAWAPILKKKEKGLIIYLIQVIVASILAYNLPVTNIYISSLGWRTAINQFWIFSCIYLAILIIVGLIRIIKKLTIKR